MNDFNPAAFVDKAIAKVDDEDLAAAIRASSDQELAGAIRRLPDEDLAELARQHDGLRRFVVFSVVQSIYDVGRSEEVATAPKPRRRPPKSGPRRRKPKPAASSSPKAGPEERRERLVELVEEAGEDGLSPGELADRLGTSLHTVRRDLEAVVDRVNVEGNTNQRRVYAA